MIRTTTAVLAATFTALAGAAAAQSPAPSAVVLESGGTVLNVTAEGRAQRQPDLVTFNAGVVTQAKTAAEALSANAERMDSVTAALRRAGVAEKDLQTATLSVQPQYYYPQPERQPDGSVAQSARPPSIIGYEARNTVTAKVRQVSNVGRIIDALAQAGANQVDGPYFTVENPEPATDEARAQAMAAARKRADLYARAAGLRVTRILTITEGGGYYPVTRDIIVTGSMAGAPPPAPPPPPPSPVQAGEITLGANLSVQFLLER